MPILPRQALVVFSAFRKLFTRPTWVHVQIMLSGAILCQGARRVSSILRVMGLSDEKRFEKYHRVLNRAKWSSLSTAKIMLGLLIAIIPSSLPVLIVVDDTVERRYGRRIKAIGRYRDACRSTEKNVVKCMGLKWVCFMLLVPLPWCKRHWALPFMTILAPSKKANLAKNRPHKTSIDWTMRAIKVISRWLKRPWILIGDGGFACINLGHQCIKSNITLISRLRLDVALYDFAPTPIKGQLGRHKVKGDRCPSLQTLADEIDSDEWKEETVNWYNGEVKTVFVRTNTCVWYSSGKKPLPIRWVLVKDDKEGKAEAFFSTDLSSKPVEIINRFVLRWNIEVTFEESRAHLGIETQRQWSDLAIARTTPVLMGLFSMVCLIAIEMLKVKNLPIAKTAWYDKKGEATFSDILSFVRRDIWSAKYFNDSTIQADPMKNKPPNWETLLDQLARAV